MFKKIVATITGIIAILAFAGVSFAATSVRLEQPKTPTNQDTFTVVFVALDTDGNSIAVNCYKKGPNDSTFSQFGNTITLSDGGNTDSCAVNSSVVNTNGMYSFYVTANGAQSNTVTVDYNTSGPDAPTNYSKDHSASCQYTISFKTANDNGKTVKVELYRSINTSFNADSGSRVQAMGIGSDTDGSFTDNVPDCNATYYYAIRSFDSAGNGSGLVGDSQTVTTVINPTVTQAAGQTQGGAIPVISSSVTEGEQQPTGQQTNDTDKKGVLGAKITPQNNFTSMVTKYAGWGLIGLGLIIALIFLAKRMKNSSR